MAEKKRPMVFDFLLSDEWARSCELAESSDGFFMLHPSLSSILAGKGIFDFPDDSGERLACHRFFDDWFLYAVADGSGYTYSLLKLREQEHDAEDGSPADGDTPGVTISFISFDCGILTDCLADPSDENRKKLSREINRVVAYRGQRHHKALKRYFQDPRSWGAYLVAERYVKTIASYVREGRLALPDHYKEIVQKSISYPFLASLARLPRFMEELNRTAGRVVCDGEFLYLANQEELTEEEALAILATHTGNTSFWSFAAEVEVHARFLTPLAKLRIPFLGRSIYDSAIRADMTVGDAEFQGAAPFYRSDSKQVMRQYELHHGKTQSENNL